jgi:DNA-binding MarR family transcriptional regulator
MENEFTTEESTHALEMLTQIEANPDISQLTLADELGVAVGTINWHLKRMIAKGYVKVKRAQRKKLRYIITPEGIALRAALTVDYIKNSFDLYRRVRERTNLCLQQLENAGYSSVNVLGEDEVAEVVRLTCLEQGVEMTNDAQAPKIRIEGIKLALKLPEAAQD